MRNQELQDQGHRHTDRSDPPKLDRLKVQTIIIIIIIIIITITVIVAITIAIMVTTITVVMLDRRLAGW